MTRPPIICPACGEADIAPAIGDGYICNDCAHLFTVVDGKAQDFEDDEDDDDARGAQAARQTPRSARKPRAR